MKTDRERWDRRYAEESSEFPEPDSFLVQHADLLVGDRALDLACGSGANALFLAGRGFVVDALDISLNALRRLQAEARHRGLAVNCALVDLDFFSLPESCYDAIVVFSFFSRHLIAPIKTALRPGGLAVYGTFNARHTGVNPGFNPEYLIEPNALARYFSDYVILVHEPDAGEARNVSRVVARKPERVYSSLGGSAECGPNGEHG